MTLNEVSPPGWGHTKAEKEKTKPNKPKSKIGGSAAAFKRALDDGRFKGLPGSTTKKEKTADMFKLMWSMKKKGDKPHYKPGTDEKKKKYQKEGTSMQDNNLFGNAYAYDKLKKKVGSKKKHDKPAVEEGVLSMIGRPKKKVEKKPEKAMDAGARVRRKVARRVHAKYVSGSTENVPDDIREGSLRKWFKGSKSKDGKGGWVNVVTGGTCASDEPGEGTPKCVSSSKRASMTKAERLSASRRKKAADPGQQSKSGAAKPTYVRTDSKKKMKEDVEYTYPNVRRNPRFSTGSKMSMKPTTGIGAKKSTKNNPDGDDIRNATYNQIKKLERKKAAQKRKTASRIVGIKKMNEDKVLKTIAKELDGASKMHKSQANKIRKHLKDMRKESTLDEACWKGYKAYGMKKKGGKMVPNCKPVGSVKKEGYQRNPEADPRSARQKRMDDPKKGINSPAFRAFMAAQQKSSQPKKKVDEENALEKRAKENEKARKFLKKDAKDSGYTDIALKASMSKGAGVSEGKGYQPEIEHSKMGDAKKKADKKRESSLPPHLQGDAIGKMKKAFATEEDKKGKGSGSKDACYHKVKASAKVWPSAYASGRLVQCRKKGAANYGKSKSEGFEGWANNTILEKTAAWTRKAGKNKEGGLNEKGRKSYEKANPGSDLKAPQPEGGSRKKSFCARMGGMKKKLTSAKTANDPDSRINKALRKWKC